MIEHDFPANPIFSIFFQFVKIKTSITVNDGIQKIKKTDDTINKKVTFLEKQIQKLENEAKELIRRKTGNNRKRALGKLKLKKLKEKELSKLMGMQFNLSVQQNALENASINTLVVASMQTANDAFKKIKKDINIDDVDELVEDLNEQHDLMEEVSNALGEPLFNTDLDEDELLAELDELEELEADQLLLPSVPETHLRPNIPQKVQETEEEKELKELEMMMN